MNPIDTTNNKNYGNLIPKEDLASFQKANPNLTFNAEDYQQYNNSVPSSNIQPTTGLNLPPAPQEQDLLAGLSGQLQTTADTSAETQKKESNTYTNLLNQLGMESADTLALQNEKGVATNEKELLDLQKVANKQQADYIAGLTQAEGARNTRQETGFVQANITRQHAIDALLTNSLISAKQGDITYANTLVDRAIKAKYDPLKAQVDAQKFILEQINTKAAQDRTNALNVKLKQIEKAQKNEEDLQKLFTESAANGAPTALLEQAKLAKTPLAAAQILGKYGGDYLGNKLKLAQIDKTYKEIDKLTNDIKASNIQINTSNLPNTTVGFQQKLLSTATKDKNLESTERQNLAKAMTVIGQLDSLQSNIAKQNKTGFLKGNTGRFLEKFSLNSDVGTINAQLQAVVPNLARGTYGEVGVLTDNDIKNYRSTLPNLTKKQDQNDAVMALTLKTVQKSIENQLSSAANSGVNVSGWASDYAKITGQVNEIEDRIGVSKNAVNALVAQDPKLAPVIKDMYTQGYSDGEILDNLNAR